MMELSYLSMKEIVCVFLFGASLYTFIIILLYYTGVLSDMKGLSLCDLNFGDDGAEAGLFCILGVCRFGMGYQQIVNISLGMMAALIGFTSLGFSFKHLRRQNVLLHSGGCNYLMVQFIVGGF